MNTAHESDAMLPAEGIMAARIGAFDWSGTPLGAMDGWSPALKVMVDVMLAAPQPAMLAVGADRILLYNDRVHAYLDDSVRPLGRSLADAWPRRPGLMARLYDRVFAGRGARVSSDELLPVAGGTAVAFDVSVTPVRDANGDVIAAYMTAATIDEPDRAGQPWRGADERGAFLLNLSDAMRAERAPQSIIATATRLLGERLGASRIVFAEIDEGAGIARIRPGWEAASAPTHPDELRLSDFGGPLLDDLCAGKTVRFDDVGAPPFARPDLAALDAIGVRAGLSVPLVVEGRLVMNLSVHQDQPRRWTDAEVALCEAVAERLWASLERARAEEELSRSERRSRRQAAELHAVLQSISDAVYIGTTTGITLANQAALDQLGYATREELNRNIDTLAEEICNRDARTGARIEDHDLPFARALGGERVVREVLVRQRMTKEDRVLRSSASPIILDGVVAGAVALNTDITETKRTDAALRDSEQRLRTLVAGIPQLVWRAVNAGQWTWASPQWTELTGQAAPESHGWGWLEAVHPDDRALAREAWRQARASGGFDVEYRIRDSEVDTYRWFQTRATPLREDTGGIAEWLGTSTDIHDLRELQESQKVLVAELQHRALNLMSVVQSLSEKTARSSTDLTDFQERFHDRLDALARVQALLSRLDQHERVTFDELVRGELAAMAGDLSRISLDGPPGVRLRSSTVQTLALVVHELATNAVKYGALGQSGARLAVTWSLEESPVADGRLWLCVNWRESGVRMPPSGSAPGGGGHGRALIERALPYQFGARTRYAFREDGVHCSIFMPILASNSIDPASPI